MTNEIDKLNIKQRLFVSEYMKDLNGKQAAIRAGYKPDNAEVIASRLLTHVKVAEEIEKATRAKEARALVSASWVVQNLKEIVERCMQKTAVMYFDKTDKTYKQKTEEDQNGNEQGVWEFDSAGAIKALELLGKHTGVFSEKNEGEKAVNDLSQAIESAIIEAKQANIILPEMKEITNVSEYQA